MIPDPTAGTEVNSPRSLAAEGPTKIDAAGESRTQTLLLATIILILSPTLSDRSATPPILSTRSLSRIFCRSGMSEEKIRLVKSGFDAIGFAFQLVDLSDRNRRIDEVVEELGYTFEHRQDALGANRHQLGDLVADPGGSDMCWFRIILTADSAQFGTRSIDSISPRISPRDSGNNARPYIKFSSRGECRRPAPRRDERSRNSFAPFADQNRYNTRPTVVLNRDAQRDLFAV